MGTDVLIAGAGPVGLILAAELARYGVAVRIVDQAKERTAISKSVVIWSRTLELLDRAGCGAAMVAAGTQVNAATMTTAARTIDRIELERCPPPHPYALMLLQRETERLLEEHLNTFGSAGRARRLRLLPLRRRRAALHRRSARQTAARRRCQVIGWLGATARAAQCGMGSVWCLPAVGYRTIGSSLTSVCMVCEHPRRSS